jgi:arylsulfatase A-like enzyme
LGEHGLFFAHDFTLYEELVHVPLFVRTPQRHAARVSAPVSLVDVLPTLCAQTRIRCPEGLDGRSLADPEEHARPAFSLGPPWRSRYATNPFIRAHGDEGRWTSLRTGELKLIRIPQPSGVRWEAYDLARDPRELQNVFDPSKHANAAAQLDEWARVQRAAAPAHVAVEGTAWKRGQIEELRSLGYLD